MSTPFSRRTATFAAFGAVFAARAQGAASLVGGRASPLAVPEGFHVQVIDRGAAAPDGMGCFAGADGSLILMRNHEVAYPGGGVSRLVLDPVTLAVRSKEHVLKGTDRNCCGGLSPWGWLSCEETFTERGGYVYLCGAEDDGLAPRKIAAYGHFNHEAATVDPETFVAFLTEDRPDSCFYRFVPRSRDTPFDGELQALGLAGRPGFATGNGLEPGAHDVVWIPVDTPDPATDGVRRAAQLAGAASFRRGEGLWLHEGRAYFTATTGGAAQRGQIFCLDGGSGDAATLTLVAESPGEATMDMPDNLTVAPWGDLFVAEDGDGEQCLRVVLARGRVVTFARNVGSGSELAGVTFAPDGETLFLNLQWDGLTVAIRGPFREWCARA